MGDSRNVWRCCGLTPPPRPGCEIRFSLRGPNRAKSYFEDDLVVVIMRGGYSRVERTLLDGGHGDAVIQQRMEFQEVMRDRFTSVVERATGRRVIGFMSGNQQDPDLMCEVFVLSPTELLDELEATHRLRCHLLQPTPFATNVLADGNDPIVALSGELDIATARQVRSVVHEPRRAGATRVLIDLRPLEFMDSQGPRVLFDLQDESGPGIALVPGRDKVQRVFDLTRTRAYFTWTTPPGSATS